MTRLIYTGLLAAALGLFSFAPVASAQQGNDPRFPRPSRWVEGQGRPHYASIGGAWYLNGDPGAPCYINERGGTAVFTDAVGVSSVGTVDRTVLAVPVLDGSGYLMGEVRGNSIVWADGNIWTR